MQAWIASVETLGASHLDMAASLVWGRPWSFRQRVW